MEQTVVLNADVVLRILSFCCIRSVLVTSQTCKLFHSLAFSKQVWLALLSDLHARFIVDIPPGEHLGDLSKDSLVDLAKRVVRGPRSWSTSYHSNPVISRQKILNANIVLGPGRLFWENEARLLPGGKYVLFNDTGLECWNLENDMLIWQYGGRWSSFWVQEFATEMADDGRSVLIVIGIRVPCHGERKNFVEVVRLNFDTKSSDTLVCHEAPHTSFDNPFARPKVCGDFLIITIHTKPSILFIQISTSSCKILELLHEEMCDLVLIPGHLMAVACEESSPSNLMIWTTESLINHTSNYVKLGEVSPLITVVIDLDEGPEGPSCDPFISCHKSPYDEDLFIVWVLISPSYPRLSTSVLHKYLISYTDSLLLHHASSNKVDKKYPTPSAMSYTGHATIFNYEGDRQSYLWSLTERNLYASNTGILEIPEAGDHVHISAYTGALAYSTPENIVVNYYE